MVGAYRVIVQNKKIKFDFEIRRNITILRGDSATGKTTLVEMIQEYEELGSDSGITLQCERNCAVLSGRQWEKQLAGLSQSIVFVDEGNVFTASKEFAAAIQKTDNYYVLVTRESLETLPYSVTEIYGIRTSKHFGDLKQTYNEFFQIYGKPVGTGTLKPAIVITEDSNSGYQFFFWIPVLSECLHRKWNRLQICKGKIEYFQTAVKWNKAGCSCDCRRRGVWVADGTDHGFGCNPAEFSCLSARIV